MCTKTILTADGDIFTVSTRDLSELRRAGVMFWVLDKLSMDRFQQSITDRFGVTKWACEPFISANICPTDFGMIVLREGSDTVVRQARFGFWRSWTGPGHNFRFDNLLPETEEFTSQGLPTYNIARNDPSKEHMKSRNRNGNPQFYHAFKAKQFCLILMRGFIEFDTETREVQLKTKKKMKEFKIPYLTEHVSGTIMAAAGLWEINEAGEYNYTFGTSEPNDLMRKFNHDRCPVICLTEAQRDMWLDPDVPAGTKVSFGLKPAPSDQFRSWRVTELINSSRNKDPRVVLVKAEGHDDAIVAA